jgi:hypothetical protein
VKKGMGVCIFKWTGVLGSDEQRGQDINVKNVVKSTSQGRRKRKGFWKERWWEDNNVRLTTQHQI